MAVNRFDNIVVREKAGIGIENPTEKLEVDGKAKATEFVGKGSEITDLKGENITTGTIDDTRISQTIARVEHKHTGDTGDGPKISHSNLIDIPKVNPGSDDSDFTKHVSNALAKGWQDHLTNTENPHRTTAAQLVDFFNLKIVQFNFTNESPAGPAPPQSLGFVPKLILISGGCNVSLKDGSSYGSVVSGFWTKEQGNSSTFEINKSNNSTATAVGVTTSSFFTKGTVSGSSGTKTETWQGIIDFQESTKSLSVKLAKRKQPSNDPVDEFTFSINLMMLCIG